MIKIKDLFMASKTIEELSKDGDVLIFTHAITKIALVRGFMRDACLHLSVSCCSLTEVEITENKRYLHKLCYNEHLFLTVEKCHPWGIHPGSTEQKEITSHLPSFYENLV